MASPSPYNDGYPNALLSEWHEELKGCRGLQYGDNFLEKRKSQTPTKDPLDLCLHDYDWFEDAEATIIKEFLKAREVDFEQVVNSTTNKDETTLQLCRNAWVDEKLIDKEGQILHVKGHCLKNVPNPLTSTGLVMRLRHKPEVKENLKHGRRRLVYVRDVHDNPKFIPALLAPASETENAALRSLLPRHILREPLLRVLIPERGLLRFIMEFHLPCYRLKYVPRASPEANETEYRKDVSFLGLQSPGQSCMLQRCQMSVSMTGVDESSYTVYGLFSGVDEYPLEPPVAKDEGEEADDEGEGSEDEGGEVDDDEEQDEAYAGDHIAADHIDLLSADPTIDPRMYFLTRFKERLRICRGFCGVLTKSLRKAFERQKEKDGRVKRRQGAKGCQTTEATDCFDWAAQMHELMDEVEGRLKQLHLVWHYFMRDGRYQFFPEHHLRRYISSIHNDFADLNQTLQDLQKLHRECRFYSQHVAMEAKRPEQLKIRMSLQRHENAEKSGITSGITFKFGFPILLTTAIFSMEKTAIPFSPRFSSVAVVCVVLLFIVCCTEWIISNGLSVVYFQECMQKLSFRKRTTDDDDDGEALDLSTPSFDAGAGDDISAETLDPLGPNPGIGRTKTDDTLVVGEGEDSLEQV